MVIDSHIHFPARCEEQPDTGARLIKEVGPRDIGARVVAHILGKTMGPDIHFPYYRDFEKTWN